MILITPFPGFLGSAGKPLDSGKVYLGTLNLNPETDPIAVYWDVELTQLAAQPLRTSGGRIVRNGALSNVYTAGASYRLTVRNSNDVLVYSVADSSSSGALAGLDLSTVVDSIADLRLIDKGLTGYTLVTGYLAPGDGGGGNYYYDSADTTSADNGGTIIVAADSARWKLQATSVVSANQFGATGDGSTDDTVAIQAAIDTLISTNQRLSFDSGTYKITSTLTIGDGTTTTPSTLNGLSLEGHGSGITEIGRASWRERGENAVGGD